jgi:Delta7-sterol 5-desaturase
MMTPATQSTLDYAMTRVADHFMFGIYFDLSRYLIAAGVLTALLLIFRGFAETRRIQLGRRATRADYTRELLSSMRTVVVYAFVTLAILVGRDRGDPHENPAGNAVDDHLAIRADRDRA